MKESICRCLQHKIVEVKETEIEVFNVYGSEVKGNLLKKLLIGVVWGWPWRVMEDFNYILKEGDQVGNTRTGALDSTSRLLKSILKDDHFDVLKREIHFMKLDFRAKYQSRIDSIPPSPEIGCD